MAPSVRSALARHWRPALPFLLWLAVPTLVGANWYLRLPCDLYAGRCFPTQFPLGFVVRAVTGIVGLAWGAVAYWLFRGGVERARRRPLGRLLFAPDDRTVAAVLALSTAAALLARPLFGGDVTADRTLWLLIAVPYYPAVIGVTVLLGLFVAKPGLVEAVTGPVVFALPDLLRSLVGLWPFLAGVLALVVTLAVNVVWLYVLARAGTAGVATTVDRARALRDAVR